MLNSLSPPRSRRSYRSAMDQFIAWHCSEPYLALNQTIVLRFRLHLESLGLAAATINQGLAAVRRLAYESMRRELRKWRSGHYMVLGGDGSDVIHVLPTSEISGKLRAVKFSQLVELCLGKACCVPVTRQCKTTVDSVARLSAIST